MSDVEVPDCDFTLTYVRRRGPLTTDALAAEVGAVFRPWKGKLEPSRQAPAELVDEQWLWVARLSDDWWAVATNAPVSDALAERLARRLRTSSVWFRRRSGTASHELRYGSAQPDARHDAEIRARQTLPLIEAPRQFLVRGKVQVKETRAHAALRAKGQCPRRHANTLDLTARFPDDPELDVDVELVDPERRQAPDFFADLAGDSLDPVAGWLRLSDERPPRQRVLWVRRCEKCASPVYAAIEWEGCMRRVRGLPKRPSLEGFHVLYDPGRVDQQTKSLRAEGAKRARARHQAEEAAAAEQAGAPLTRAIVEQALREESAEDFHHLLMRGAAHGPKELVREAVQRLLAWDDAFYASASTRWPTGLSLVALLDFEGPLTAAAAARVGLDCLRLGLTVSAETCFKKAAPLSARLVADLRRRVELRPLALPHEGGAAEERATLLEAWLTRG